MITTTLTTPGLVLRPWTEEDIPAMVAAHQDPAMRRWLRRTVTTVEEARRIIQARQADAQDGTGVSFAVLRAAAGGDPGDVVGSVSLRGLGGPAVSGEVGYWVAASARGQGIATRALNAVCDWAFERPWPRPLERLELIHAVGNQASCRVAVNAGFSLSAVLPPNLPEFPGEGHRHTRPATG